MDTFILVLKVMLYLAAIVLLVVLAVLGVKAIKVMEKTDKLLDDVDKDYVDSSKKLNEIIEEKSNKLNIPVKVGKIITSDVFDLYCDDIDKFRSNYKDKTCLGVEMESFALFYLANKFKIEATTLSTVVDSLYDKRSLSSEERQTGLNNMIELALESII